MILFLKSFLQVVVHGFMESDSYSPLLNISVIPQVTYRLVILNTPYISPHTIQPLISHLTPIFCDLSITFHPLGTSHLEENVQL